MRAGRATAGAFRQGVGRKGILSVWGWRRRAPAPAVVWDGSSSLQSARLGEDGERGVPRTQAPGNVPVPRATLLPAAEGPAYTSNSGGSDLQTAMEGPPKSDSER